MRGARPYLASHRIAVPSVLMFKQFRLDETTHVSLSHVSDSLFLASFHASGLPNLLILPVGICKTFRNLVRPRLPIEEANKLIVLQKQQGRPKAKCDMTLHNFMVNIQRIVGLVRSFLEGPTVARSSPLAQCPRPSARTSESRVSLRL